MRKIGVYIFLSLILLVTSFTVIYLTINKVIFFIEKPGSKIEEPLATSVELEFKEVFSLCGHEETVEKKIVLLSEVTPYESIVNKYPKWQIHEYSQDKVVLRRDVDGLCSEDREYRHLGIKDGYVVAFYGKPRADALMIKTTKIDVRYLPEDEVQILKEGLIVKDDSELLHVLEGLASLQPF